MDSRKTGGDHSIILSLVATLDYVLLDREARSSLWLPDTARAKGSFMDKPGHSGALS